MAHVADPYRTPPHMPQSPENVPWAPEGMPHMSLGHARDDRTVIHRSLIFFPSPPNSPTMRTPSPTRVSKSADTMDSADLVMSINRLLLGNPSFVPGRTSIVEGAEMHPCYDGRTASVHPSACGLEGVSHATCLAMHITVPEFGEDCVSVSSWSFGVVMSDKGVPASDITGFMMAACKRRHDDLLDVSMYFLPVVPKNEEHAKLVNQGFGNLSDPVHRNVWYQFMRSVRPSVRCVTFNPKTAKNCVFQLMRMLNYGSDDLSALTNMPITLPPEHRRKLLLPFAATAFGSTTMQVIVKEVVLASPPLRTVFAQQSRVATSPVAMRTTTALPLSAAIESTAKSLTFGRAPVDVHDWAVTLPPMKHEPVTRVQCVHCGNWISTRKTDEKKCICTVDSMTFEDVGFGASDVSDVESDDEQVHRGQERGL